MTALPCPSPETDPLADRLIVRLFRLAAARADYESVIHREWRGLLPAENAVELAHAVRSSIGVLAMHGRRRLTMKSPADETLNADETSLAALIRTAGRERDRHDRHLEWLVRRSGAAALSATAHKIAALAHQAGFLAIDRPIDPPALPAASEAV